MLAAFAPDAAAQARDSVRTGPARETAGEWAWRFMHEQDSVVVRYIHYTEADNENSGIVLRLDNRSTRAIRYRFTALFLSGDDRAEQRVEGRLEAGGIVTGDADGLFFIPFPDGRPVTEVGLRGFRVEREVRGL